MGIVPICLVKYFRRLRRAILVPPSLIIVFAGPLDFRKINVFFQFSVFFFFLHFFAKTAPSGYPANVRARRVCEEGHTGNLGSSGEC